MRLKLHITVLLMVFLNFYLPLWTILILMNMARSKTYHWVAVTVYTLTIWFVILKLIAQWEVLLWI